uniref:DNA replication licensing factor MCM3 n=1 Tax=Salmo trutta TaxID=8032 RepID=A0A673XX61_SALTR
KAGEIRWDHSTLELREAQREYLDFLDDDQDQSVYHERVKSMVSENRCRLIVNINDLRRRNEKRAKALLKDSFSELVAFQRALKDLVASIDATYAKQFEEFHVGFEGSFGTKHVTPRSLAARYLGNLVCVEGIVTKCSLVRPKITRSVHYCPATKKTLERKYTDLTSLDAFPSSSIYPTKDEENNPLETEFGLCVYKDHQTLTIQEMPEKAPAGQLPRSVDIIANDDLVDMVKPGDRVQMVGIYRCLPAKQGGFTSGTFRTILLANHVKRMSKEIVPTFSAEDINKIKKFCKSHSKDVFEHLSCSLAPSIHGHEYIKKAILCLLLGGNETNLENGTRIRGDINILLIGDPSTAKSQLLRYVLHTAPRAIPTTGRGSTGVGLTAAVTTDQETGERRLEAGAMVLADRGVVCIDEFDKMSDMDRTAIHEVMEQGRVTIAKAGIMARLNARCSVLAAANPVYGRYDQYKTPMENIGLQDSLLSRFDLLFIVLDQMDADSDRKVSEHVLRMHRYRAPGEQEGTAMPMGSTVDVFATEDPNITESAEQELQIYEKKDNVLHGHRNKKEKVVTMEFIRKYIHVAKLVKPVLTQEASDHIAEEYSKLRSHDQVTSESARTMPVTARALETMIRLSTAHAKARMSKTTDLVDAEAALELMQFAYFKKILEKRRKVVEDDMGVTQSQSQSQSQEVASQRTSTRSEPIFKKQLKLFKAALMKAFQTTRSQSVAVTELLTLVNKTTRGQDDHEFDEQEVEKLLGRMQDDNQVMMSEGVVFLI